MNKTDRAKQPLTVKRITLKPLLRRDLETVVGGIPPECISNKLFTVCTSTVPCD